MRTILAAAVALAGAAALAVAAPPASRAANTNFVPIWSFGGNASGQLGDGTSTQRNSPVRVTALIGQPVELVAAGGATGAALTIDGTVWTWGDNSHGTLGNGTTGGNRNTAAPVPGLSGISFIAVAYGGADVYAVRASDGTVWAWGANERGQLGTGASSSGPVTSAKQVQGLTGVIRVAGGVSYALAVRSDGTVWAWGDNRRSQLGDRTTVQRNAPVRVAGLTSIRTVTGTSTVSFATSTDGNAYAWGTDVDSTGILGLGPGSVGAAVTGPVRIPDLSNVGLVAADAAHALAVTIGPSLLYAWGSNVSGDLGDGTTTPKSSPEQVPMPDIVQGIAAGPGFSAAFLDDGSLWTWGDNSHGQLGYGTCCTAVNPSPGKVSVFTSAALIVAGTDWMLLAGRTAATPP